MTDNLKQRIAEAIGEAIAYSHGFSSSQSFDDAAQAVLDIVEPMLRQREQHIQALMLKQHESHCVVPTTPEKE